MKTKITHSYLYADGHAVVIHEQRVKLGTSFEDVSFAVIHEKWTDAAMNFKGRLCFSRYGGALLELCRKATHIAADAASLENGSENTKRMGIAIGSLEITFKDGTYLHWMTMPGLIGGNHTYQPDGMESFNPDERMWGSYKVTEIKRVKQAVQIAAAA